MEANRTAVAAGPARRRGVCPLALIVIAMGLAFVLLLGEIDLSAGYEFPVTGAILLLAAGFDAIVRRARAG